MSTLAVGRRKKFQHLELRVLLTGDGSRKTSPRMRSTKAIRHGVWHRRGQLHGFSPMAPGGLSRRYFCMLRFTMGTTLKYRLAARQSSEDCRAARTHWINLFPLSHYNSFDTKLCLLNDLSICLEFIFYCLSKFFICFKINLITSIFQFSWLRLGL